MSRSLFVGYTSALSSSPATTSHLKPAFGKRSSRRPCRRLPCMTHRTGPDPHVIFTYDIPSPASFVAFSPVLVDGPTMSAINLIQHVKPRLMWNQHSQITDPPNTQPVSIHCFMRDVLDITDELGKVLWETFAGLRNQRTI
ncbi:hypothetical protein JB92DRAFT_3121027 [Gautieria morchelliformis]|nr:hypothetical protein JB92DRAFT_3121027 [Gautieria morchelliformis]